jgi:hypothetical protein
MAARYYQTLLGVPGEIPDPDYFQLLGIAADPFDEEALRQGLRDRLDRLDAAPEALKPVAGLLKRELQRARAMLMDPKRRAEYQGELREQRVRSVAGYVGALVVDGVLGDATERALLARLARLGLPSEHARPAIDAALDWVGARRGPGGGANEDAEVLERMHEVAGAQLLEAAGVEVPPLAPREAPEAGASPVSSGAPVGPEAAVPAPAREPEVREPEPAPAPSDPGEGPIRRARRKTESLPAAIPAPPPRPEPPQPPPPVVVEPEGPIRRQRKPEPPPPPAPEPPPPPAPEPPPPPAAAPPPPEPAPPPPPEPEPVPVPEPVSSEAAPYFGPPPAARGKEDTGPSELEVPADEVAPAAPEPAREDLLPGSTGAPERVVWEEDPPPAPKPEPPAREPEPPARKPEPPAPEPEPELLLPPPLIRRESTSPPSPKTRPVAARREIQGVATREDEDMIDEQERRSARRASRTWLAFFLIVAAFAVGELAGAFAPGVSTRVETATAPYRQKIVEIPEVRTYAVVAAGLGVVLLGLLVYLAGHEKRRGFLILAVLFMLPAGYMGLIPLGRLRTLIADKAEFDAKLDAATGERDRAAAERDRVAADRDRAAAERDRAAADREEAQKKVAELEKQAAAQAGSLDALRTKLDEVAAGMEKISKAAEAQRSKQDEQVEGLRKKLDDVASELGKATKAAEDQRGKQDEIIEALRKELDELKKK